MTMGKLAPDETPTEDLVITYTIDEIHAGLALSAAAARKARERGDQESLTFAHEYIDAWLDRLPPC